MTFPTDSIDQVTRKKKEGFSISVPWLFYKAMVMRVARITTHGTNRYTLICVH